MLKTMLCLVESRDAVTVFAPSDTAFIHLKVSQPALYGYLTSGNSMSNVDLKYVNLFLKKNFF